jgi:cysteine synthase A
MTVQERARGDPLVLAAAAVAAQWEQRLAPAAAAALGAWPLLLLLLAAAFLAGAAALHALQLARSRASAASRTRVARSLAAAVGKTPLLELKSLSAVTGRTILAKCEHLNPGGSVKDRPVAAMLADAVARGVLKPGALLVEPSGGNTGLSLAAMALPAGYRLHITVPAGLSEDKVTLMRRMGAEVTECDAYATIADAGHFVNVAKALAKRHGGVMLDQFDNLANCAAQTALGEEIWAQSGGRLDAFVAAAGTGGTLAGVSRALKTRDRRVRAFNIDPPGSCVQAFVERGVFQPRPGEEKAKTIVDGIGICRSTANLRAALVDAAFAGTDREAVEMSYFLLRAEGLFVGPSAALNVCGAVKAARRLPPGAVVVTLLCDGGERYRSKTFSDAWLAAHDLVPRATGTTDISFVL